MQLFISALEMIGTVAFAASGALTAMRKKMDLLGVIVLGVVTAVGGGVLRDILAGNTPYIFVKHVYACASLLGATVCALLWRIVPSYVAMLTGMLCVLILRLLSAYFRWNLPHTDDKI